MGFILFLSYEGFITMDKKRPSDTAFSSSASKRRNKSEDELKKGSDEAFHLSEDRVVEILILIRSGGTPKTDNKWDEYATSFYNKTLACKTRFTLLGKHQVEEETEDDISTDEEKEKVDAQYLSPSEVDGDQDEDMESTHSEEGYCRPELFGPFDFGSYSSGNEPKSIPYHLYLLVKEAVDIMKPFEGCSSSDVTKLTLVEEKIWFFCRYFHCHLPTGWEYDRDTAHDVVASYDHTHTHRYDMAGYTPITSFEGPLVDDEFDAETELSRNELICVMSVIHSRKTPAYWEMSPGYVLFYCKLCSCFGIDYDCLEAASEEDVRLMYVGLELDP